MHLFCKVRLFLALSAILVLGSTVSAQVRIRGQIFFPNGEPVGQVMRYSLLADDPRRPEEIFFTDSQGRFFHQGLIANKWYSIRVESDGKTYATTTESFLASGQGAIPIHLKPLEEKKVVTSSPTISFAKLGHEPPREARKAYEDAMKAVEEKKIEEAQKKLARAVEIDPDFVSAYNELGVLALGQKKYAEAEVQFRRALRADSSAVHPLINLGMALNHMGRHADAVVPLREALKQQPNWITPLVQLGIALVETNQLPEAESLLIRGSRSTGREQGMSFLYLGKLYVQKGDAGKAVAAWKTYLHLDPDSPNARNIRSLLPQLEKKASQ